MPASGVHLSVFLSQAFDLQVKFCVSLSCGSPSRVKRKGNTEQDELEGSDQDAE